MNLWNLKDIELTDAMRLFFRAFDMPGEAQKIERISYQLGDKYIEDNVDYNDPDTIGVLVFSIIMLHSNIHNPNTLTSMKMSIESFSSMCKMANLTNGKVTLEDIYGMYHSVCKKPIA